MAEITKSPEATGIQDLTQSVKVVEVSVQDANEKSSENNEEQIPGPAWEKGWKNRIPWLGFGALFFVLLCCIGSCLILLFSDARPATEWPRLAPPNVLLSITNGLSSIAITVAVGEGVAIAWWRRAYLGASIKELHYTWSFSQSLTTIFLKAKYFNMIALAALMTKVAVIDGVLFQRATSTYVGVSSSPATLGSLGSGSVQAFSSTKFPISGYFGGTPASTGQMDAFFAQTVENWLSVGNGIDATDRVLYCEGLYCIYALPGAGFSIDCNITHFQNNFTIDTRADVNTSATQNLTLFDVNFDLMYPNAHKNYSWLQMHALWPTNTKFQNASDPYSSECPTKFTDYMCELRPAVLNYTIYYQNASSVERSRLHDSAAELKKDSDTSSRYVGDSGSQLARYCQSSELAFTDDCFQYNTVWRQAAGIKVLNQSHATDYVEPFDIGNSSTLTGILQALKGVFSSRSVMSFDGTSYNVDQNGLFASQMQGQAPDRTDYCNYTYSPPVADILFKLNTLMLQMSTNRDLYDEGYTVNASGYYTNVYNRNVQADQYYKDRYYSTIWAYVWAALALTLVAIMCILPSFWGFWKLGRSVTLGPVEIAYAFQGPAFSALHGIKGQAKEVVKQLGGKRIQYAEIVDEDGRRYAFKMD